MNYKGFVKKFLWNDAPIKAVVVDAKRPVELLRTTGDLVGAKKANNEYCINANCVMRHAKSGMFPHPVMHSWFIKSTAYVLRATNARTKKGNFIVVRYHHDNWKDIIRFDRGEPFIVDKRIVLRVPSKAQSLGVDRNRKRGGAPGGSHGKRKDRTPEPKGFSGRELSLKKWQDNQKIARGGASA